MLYYSAKKYIYTLRYILLLYNIGVLLSRAFFYFCRIAAELLIFHSFFHQFAQQQKTHPPPCILRPKIFSDSDWYTVYIFPKSWYTDKSLFHKAKQRQRCVQRCTKPKSEVKRLFTQIKSLGLFGLNAFPVDVEVSMGRGKPQFEIVGLPDASVRESRERIRSALASLSIALPARQITVNLAPADVKKVGTMHDLAILLGILVCMERIPPQPENRCFLGEVSLSGHVRSISGVLPMALLAAQSGIRELFVPEENAAEASAVGIPIYGVHCLSNLLTHLEDTARPILRQQPTYVPQPEDYQDTLDFADVKGQQNAKYALEIAAAGSHNALMIGSPGSGKSMLAKRIPSILPEMTAAESMETTQIYSIAGLLDSGKPLMTKRPFRAPHHTISGAGLVGGGTIPRPGEISLAHNGLLFLDELAEFDHRTLEIMRQPLEDRRVTITRASGTVSYPCSFMLVGAMNPCPCGYYGHPKRQCTCTDRQVRQYLNRISGPLLDRFDLHIEVEPVSFDSLSARAKAESSAAIRERVQAAREWQNQRFSGTGIFCNAAIPAGMLQDFCPMDDGAVTLLRAVFDKLGLSARAYDRILKVARTIADLDGSDIIRKQHIASAAQFRSLDRKYWGTGG